jgi:capsular polysaccharide transport system permease protein
VTLSSVAAVQEAPSVPPTPQLPANASGATVTPFFFSSQPRRVAPKLSQRLPSLRTVSFAAVVALPVAIAAFYYLAIAADQYVAEFRMSLRTVDAPRVEPLLLFSGDAVRATAATESQIVTQYIASRAIIDDLDPQLNLRQLFSSSEADWWARLWLPTSAEQLLRYWQGQVDPFYDTSTGTIVVRARAFAPDDALRLAQAIVTSSEKLINELSMRARRDALGYAEAEVATAETRLKAALAAVRDFRDREGLIDPGKAADANATLAAKLRDDLLKANSELATLKAYMRDDAPPVRVLKARIRSLDAQQRALAHEMTASSLPKTAPPPTTPALSQELGSYEPLDAERKFAETAYQHALEALDRARDNADRQHIYIESFVPPSLPQTALYPHRWRSLGVVTLLGFAVWAIGGLAVQSIRDHI